MELLKIRKSSKKKLSKDTFKYQSKELSKYAERRASLEEMMETSSFFKIKSPDYNGISREKLKKNSKLKIQNWISRIYRV